MSSPIGQGEGREKSNQFQLDKQSECRTGMVGARAEEVIKSGSSKVH